MGNINNRNKFRNFILVFVSLVVCLGIASAGYIYNFLGKFSSKSDAVKIKPVTVKSNEPFNILVMGVDIGNPGSKVSSYARTDTIMLMNYNPRVEELNIISIPRDTLIMMKNNYKKINEAHVIGGPKYLIDAVEKMLNIKVNYYGKLDYEGFRKTIDAIGPIEVKIPNNMNFDDNDQNLHIRFNKGEVVQLDGKKAEEFFRWRKNNDGTGLADGDLGRIKNQQLFVGKVIEKLKSPGIIPRIPGILSVIPKYAESNMNPEDIIKYGYMFSQLDKSRIRFATLKGDAEYIAGISYVIYDEKKNKDILSWLHYESAFNN
jgi:polyisoprenyl-teichoic acid--peptidoglycan teichoic acid transferase